MAGDCGDCKQCCRALGIKELKKPVDKWCDLCSETGCGIYESRPLSCTIYECVWLMTQQSTQPLPVSMRPDQSKVVFSTFDEDPDTLVAHCPSEERDAWKVPPMLSLIKAALDTGIKRCLIGWDEERDKVLVTLTPWGDLSSKKVRMSLPDKNGIQWLET
jgi:hypothetical protein